jgi:hypothetical protein
MTSYNRRGHYRRRPNGQRVWVSSHTVSRSIGQGYSLGITSSISPPAQRTIYPAGFIPTTRLPRSIGLVRPNAVCAVCGAHVYFYANEFGSRVYFDEMGPPWPKHPCTDSGQPLSANGTRRNTSKAPVLYPDDVGRRKLADSPSGTASRAFTVEGSWLNERGTLLHLQRVYRKATAEAWITPKGISLEVGQLVFVDGGYLSYLDPQTVDVVRVEVSFQPPTRKESFFKRLRARLDR